MTPKNEVRLVLAVERIAELLALHLRPASAPGQPRPPGPRKPRRQPKLRIPLIDRLQGPPEAESDAEPVFCALPPEAADGGLDI